MIRWSMLSATENVECCRKSQGFLQKTLEQTVARHSIGEMTSTDVATARAQLAEAITKAVESQVQLELARATF